MRKIAALLLLVLFLVVSPVLAAHSATDVEGTDRCAVTGTVHLTRQASLTSEDAVLHYTITAAASQQLPSMMIIPQIWQRGSRETVLVFTGEPVTCMNTTDCTAEGSFTPPWDFANVTATYFIEGTMQYTVPDKFLPPESRGGTGQYEMSYQSGDAGLVPEVVVTGTLNLLGPGEVADPLNANNTIPFGGTIEHGMQGDIPMTVVYDAKGLPQYLADDRKTSDAFTPGGLKKATWVHEVPSGTLITETSESSLEYSLNGENIGCIRSYYSYPIDAEKSSNGTVGIISPFWVEFAEAPIPADTLGEFSTQWNVPPPPSRLDKYTQIAQFNSISPRDGSEIFQPVLEYHWRDDPRDPDPGEVYSAAVWDIGVGKMDTTHSPRIYGFSEGDHVVGDIKWQDEAWFGQINKVGSSTSTSTIAIFFKKPVATIEVVLEGHSCPFPSNLPGDLSFENFVIKDRNQQQISPSFEGYVNRGSWPEHRFPNLEVIIRRGPQISLVT